MLQTAHLTNTYSAGYKIHQPTYNSLNSLTAADYERIIFVTVSHGRSYNIYFPSNASI